MLDRLQGLENEYAIRFRSFADRPDHHDVFLAVRAAMATFVDTAPGERNGRDPFFVSNGGSFCYEAVASAHDGGLIEGATPECRGPAQTLLYQRAQEALLLKALPRAQAALASAGHPGELALLRNCRDAEGHIYGAQENYEAEIASGPTLLLLRLCLVAMCGVSAVVTLSLWALLLVLILPLIVALVATAVGVALVEARSEEAGDRVERRLRRIWQRVGWPRKTQSAANHRVMPNRRTRNAGRFMSGIHVAQARTSTAPKSGDNIAPNIAAVSRRVRKRLCVSRPSRALRSSWMVCRAPLGVSVDFADFATGYFAPKRTICLPRTPASTVNVRSWRSGGSQDVQSKMTV